MGIYKKILSCEDRLPYIILLVALGGVLAAGIGDSLSILYGYWILLGLGYAVVFGKYEETE